MPRLQQRHPLGSGRLQPALLGDAQSLPGRSDRLHTGFPGWEKRPGRETKSANVREWWFTPKLRCADLSELDAHLAARSMRLARERHLRGQLELLRPAVQVPMMAIQSRHNTRLLGARHARQITLVALSRPIARSVAAEKPSCVIPSAVSRSGTKWAVTAERFRLSVLVGVPGSRHWRVG